MRQVRVQGLKQGMHPTGLHCCHNLSAALQL